MDGLVIPALSTRQMIACKKQEEIHGATQCEEIPSYIKHFVVKDEIALQLIQNTFKVAVLEGEKQTELACNVFL